MASGSRAAHIPLAEILRLVGTAIMSHGMAAMAMKNMVVMKSIAWRSSMCLDLVVVAIGLDGEGKSARYVRGWLWVGVL